MIREVTVRQYGGSLGTTLPKAMTDRLALAAGDRVFAVETPHGILLTPYDPHFARVLNAEQRITRAFRNALRSMTG